MATVKRCIVLQWTTDEQIEWLKAKLDQMSREAWERYNKSDVHSMTKEEELEVNALQNICCDLEVPGYEMS